MRFPFVLIFLFAISCGGDDDGPSNPATTGSVEVTTTTTGQDPDDIYSISLDGVLQDWIGPNASRTLTELDPGAYIVALGDVGWHCTVDPVSAQRAVNVTAGAVEDVAFAIHCVVPPPPPPPPPPDLSGTYELVSVTQGGVTLGPAEGATGTLSLTQTRYSLSVTVPGPTGPVTTEDTGSYWVDGNVWVQESDNTGGVQGVGIYSLVGDVLTIDVTTAGVQVVTVWNKAG